VTLCLIRVSDVVVFVMLHFAKVWQLYTRAAKTTHVECVRGLRMFAKVQGSNVIVLNSSFQDHQTYCQYKEKEMRLFEVPSRALAASRR
jgi:hypothetical protein